MWQKRMIQSYCCDRGGGYNVTDVTGEEDIILQMWQVEEDTILQMWQGRRIQSYRCDRWRKIQSYRCDMGGGYNLTDVTGGQ